MEEDSNEFCSEKNSPSFKLTGAVQVSRVTQAVYIFFWILADPGDSR